MLVNKGFTLLELITVIIILGILAAIALPQYFRVAERGRAAEGVHVLGMLQGSQMRYAMEFGTTTNNMSLLDTSIGSPTFFNAPTITGGVNPRTSPGSVVVTIVRNGLRDMFGGYTLTITANGTVDCTGGDPTACAILGY